MLYELSIPARVNPAIKKIPIPAQRFSFQLSVAISQMMTNKNRLIVVLIYVMIWLSIPLMNGNRLPSGAKFAQVGDNEPMVHCVNAIAPARRAPKLMPIGSPICGANERYVERIWVTKLIITASSAACTMVKIKERL